MYIVEDYTTMICIRLGYVQRKLLFFFLSFLGKVDVPLLCRRAGLGEGCFSRLLSQPLPPVTSLQVPLHVILYKDVQADSPASLRTLWGDGPLQRICRTCCHPHLDLPTRAG